MKPASPRLDSRRIPSCQLEGKRGRTCVQVVENVVARAGIEPPTPAFSGPRSTTELSGLGNTIPAGLPRAPAGCRFENHLPVRGRDQAPPAFSGPRSTTELSALGNTIPAGLPRAPAGCRFENHLPVRGRDQ